MKRICVGKTKDVYLLNNGHYLLKFKDDVTGEKGVFDPGANTVGLSMEGIGKANLMMSAYFFEKLTEKGIKTHFVSANVDNATMEVLPARMFGKGLEVICRYRATGSFVRRYALYVKEGMKLPGYVEFTLKDDERGDPLVTAEGLDVLGIMPLSQSAQIKDTTLRVASVVRDILSGKELELYDIKLEFGHTDDGIMLIDEIASGNMRVYKDGNLLDPIQLTSIILDE